MLLVSIIVPCYNEQSTIQLLLESIYTQSIQRSEIEVIIADGLSSDQTRDKVTEFQNSHPDLQIRIVDNHKKNIPAGLNCALAVAGGDYIVRLDAHSMPARDYVELCIADLKAGLGENVGGVWDIRPSRDSLVAKAIALAASHPFGVGDAKYRYGTEAGWVDTVPFGSFAKKTFQKYGLFDETLLTNEDYEFNSRIKKGGGRVWFNPAIRSIYFARSTLGELGNQYWRYGYWKWRMLRRYPETVKWRQALPPLFVLSIITVVLLFPWFWLARVALLAELTGYILALTAGTMFFAREKMDWKSWFGMILAMITMHMSWGTGFLWSAVSSMFKG
jgi:succinoglycan biosynthesis protein ExoA